MSYIEKKYSIEEFYAYLYFFSIMFISLYDYNAKFKWGECRT